MIARRNAEVDGLRRSGLFGEIQVVVRNDTADPDVAGSEFLLWYKVSTTGPRFSGEWFGGWQLRPADRRVKPVSVQHDPGAGDLGRVPSWVRSVEDGMKRLQNGYAGGPATAGKSSGTAFAVNASGYVLSNHHVVENCSDISLVLDDGRMLPALMVARDAANDLAMLKVDTTLASWVRIRSTPLRQGEAVVAIGFPLSSLLSSNASITTGNVSALSGVKDDMRHLQFTAPVQPGNSGGPLLDNAGRLVGVVTAKLDSVEMIARTGGLPQNVNFAVKSSLVQEFAATHGVTLESAPAAPPLDPAEIFARAKSHTMRVDCTIGRQPA